MEEGAETRLDVGCCQSTSGWENDIPGEVLQYHIFARLSDLLDLIACSTVCQHWHESAMADPVWIRLMPSVPANFITSLRALQV